VLAKGAAAACKVLRALQNVDKVEDDCLVEALAGVFEVDSDAGAEGVRMDIVAVAHHLGVLPTVLGFTAWWSFAGQDEPQEAQFFHFDLDDYRICKSFLYLTDVDEMTHTFSVIPGSAQTADPGELGEYDQSAAHHIEGKSGTAVVVNSYTFHAGNVRNTAAERRTIHIYCGRSSDEHLSNCTIFPPRLWEGNDEATRHYYNRLNPISELVLNRF